MNFIVKILTENDYLMKSIMNTMKNRIKYLIKNSNMINKKNLASNKKIIWFTILYVNNILDEFKGITNNAVSKIAFYSINKFCSLIKIQKDPLPTSSQRNVDYKIACKDCETSYVRQTN